MRHSPQDCAMELLRAVPHLMGLIRSTVRSRSGPELSIPQFRALAFLGREEQATLSEVAGHLGLTLPAASKLIDGVVTARLATRRIDRHDRRRVALQLTAAGQQKYAAARICARNFLAGRLAHLSDPERATVSNAMHILHAAFAEPSPPTRESKNGQKAASR